MHDLTFEYSLILNPQGRYYHALKDQLSSAHEDMYYGGDALHGAQFSRLSTETRRLLRLHPHAGRAIKHVFYPKWTSKGNYEQCRKRGLDGVPTGGFGGLLSITFHSEAASRTFFDSLPINEGPSLGTDFSLTCPYTVLAHFGEFEWAAKYVVDEGLVRMSVGLEGREDLLGRLKIAMEAAIQI